MAFLSGKTGSATFAGTTYKITGWTARSFNQVQDVTNGESGGYGEYVAGVSDVDWEVTGDYYTGNSPFASGKLVPGQTGQLTLQQSTAGASWVIQGIVEEAENTLEVRGKVSFRARGKGSWNGSSNFTMPTT